MESVALSTVGRVLHATCSIGTVRGQAVWFGLFQRNGASAIFNKAVRESNEPVNALTIIPLYLTIQVSLVVQQRKIAEYCE